VLRFHTSIKYPVTLDIFGLAAAFWLWCEIEWFRTVKPLRLLEKAGEFSYSMYLVHVPILHLLGVAGWIEMPAFAFLPAMLCVVLSGSWIFGLLIERPFRTIAKRASARMSKKPSADLVTAG
jgi:peptidoglycan/LPS O-acetylase OafA/YrhL